MGNLRVGSRGSEVTQLQQYLKSLGLYSGNIDGIFGPQTQNAVRSFQTQQGISADGIVGPITRSRMSSGTGQANPRDAAIDTLAQNDPRFAQIHNSLSEYGDISADMILESIDSGNYSGMPFTARDVEREIERQSRTLDPYYTELRERDTADLSGDLGLLQSQFSDYLASSGEEFLADKEASDVSAANQGVLFSTGRTQKLGNLKTAYERDQESKRKQVTNSISKAARDFQYQYGNDEANKLRDFYKLGSSSFDAMTPGGNVSTGGLSSVYNPSSQNFYGSRRREQNVAATQRAGNTLAARARKLVPNTR